MTGFELVIISFMKKLNVKQRLCKRGESRKEQFTLKMRSKAIEEKLTKIENYLITEVIAENWRVKKNGVLFSSTTVTIFNRVNLLRFNFFF